MRQLRLCVRGLVTFTLRESDVFYTSVVVGYDCVSRRDLPVAGRLAGRQAEIHAARDRKL
jgi:hypothetical protein